MVVGDMATRKVHVHPAAATNIAIFAPLLMPVLGPREPTIRRAVPNHCRAVPH